MSVLYNPYANLPDNVYKTVLHYHSTVSDGDATPAAMAAAYAAAGFEVAITADHDAAQGADPEVDGLLWIPGIEETGTDLSSSYQHYVTFPQLANDASAVGQTIIDNAEIAGIAHPNMNNPALFTTGAQDSSGGMSAAEAIALTNYDTIAVYNPFSVCGEASDVWDAVLSTGRQVFGHAEDDCHELYGHDGAWLGRCWNMVYAAACTQDAIVEAFRAGQFYATRGPLITITATLDTMTVASPTTSRFRFYGKNHEILHEVASGTEASYRYAPRDLFVRCEVMRLSTSMKAWTQPVFLAPAYQRRTAPAAPSLLVGSDTLGWVELGGKAALGQMTKAMPGGDGSLDFTLYGDDAWAARNVLVPGDSRVILSAGGEVLWGGRVANDPVRHRLSCQSQVEVACSGLYGLAARDGRYGYIGIDTDLEQWRQYRGIGEHSGRFILKTEGVLELRAENDRTYSTWDSCQLSYFIGDGLISGQDVAGIDFEYKLHLNSGWEATIYAGDDPPSSSGVGDIHWQQIGALNVASWTPDSCDVASTLAWPCLVLQLICTAGGKPADDNFVRLRKVQVSGVESGGSANFNPTIGDILTDIATAVGVTSTSVDSTLAAYEVEQFVARFPTDKAETLRQAVNLYTSPVEAFFDLDPATREERFTARVQPADTALAGNRLWVVGGRGGEDTGGLVRDWESTPEQIAVLYACKDDADGLPDGTVRRVDYPGGDESDLPCAETVDLTQDKGNMSAATAGNYAQAIYAARQSNRYTGEVAVAQTAHDEHGAEVPTYRLRPGDRLTALTHDDTDRFGETLYVQGTSYDWKTNTGVATIGAPFDPLETGYKGKGTYKVRTGIA